MRRWNRHVPHIENRYAGTASGFDHAADLRQHEGPVADVGQYPHLSVIDQNGNTRGLAHLGHRLRHFHPERVLHAGDAATPTVPNRLPVPRGRVRQVIASLDQAGDLDLLSVPL
jgi:hypothetical protein